MSLLRLVTLSGLTALYVGLAPSAARADIIFNVSMNTAPLIVNEVTLVGSRCGRFEPALELLRLGTINVSDMISERLPLEKAKQAFELAGSKGVLKVLLG